MNEREWLESTDPAKMLEFLRGKASHRKLRLFLIATCRACWHLCNNRPSQQAVEMAERHLEVPTDEMEIAIMSKAAWKVPTPHGPESAFAYLAARTLDKKLYTDWGYADEAALESLARHGGRQSRGAQCQLLLDIFGPLFFRPVTIDPSWLTPTITALAQGIYTDHNFTDLPILADALEEAGCTGDDILSHVRGPGPHTRGCWALDLVLGKE